MTIFAEFLGYLAGFCTAVLFLPQAIKIIRTKDVSGLSLVTCIINTIGMISWTGYGYYLHSVQMVIFNGISLVFTLIVLGLIISGKQKVKKHSR